MRDFSRLRNSIIGESRVCIYIHVIIDAGNRVSRYCADDAESKSAKKRAIYTDAIKVKLEK